MDVMQRCVCALRALDDNCAQISSESANSESPCSEHNTNMLHVYRHENRKCAPCSSGKHGFENDTFEPIQICSLKCFTGYSLSKIIGPPRRSRRPGEDPTKIWRRLGGEGRALAFRVSKPRSFEISKFRRPKGRNSVGLAATRAAARF